MGGITGSRLRGDYREGTGEEKLFRKGERGV